MFLSESAYADVVYARQYDDEVQQSLLVLTATLLLSGYVMAMARTRGRAKEA